MLALHLEKELAQDLCGWFVDNKLSIHFGKDKTKSILFTSKQIAKNIPQLDIKLKAINIKQHLEITYMNFRGCVLDKAMSGEQMALKVINEGHCKLKFLYWKNRFVRSELQRMLWSFDYACPA